MAEIQDYKNPRRKPEVTTESLENLQTRNLKTRSVVKRVIANDTDPIMVIKYKGQEASCTISTAANNTILSKIGDVGSEAADALFTVGAVSGTIDLTNASANIYGEVVDFINGIKDSDGLYCYEAWLIGALRADDCDTVGAIVATSATQCKTDAGLTLYADTSVTDRVSFVISGRQTGEAYEPLSAINKLYRVTGTFTYTGTGTYNVYEIDDVTLDETLLWTVASAASTSETDVTTLVNTNLGGLETSKPGLRLLVRFVATTSIDAAAVMQIVGSTAKI